MPKTLPVYFYLLLLCGLIVANTYLYKIIFASPVLEVSVRSVGKGRATTIRTPHNKTLLIDTGSDASILRTLGETLPPWQRTIDAVMFTGDKSLYTGGLPAIESQYRIKDRVNIGDQTLPYGGVLTFNETFSVSVIAPGIFTISYGSASILVSSSTEPRTYALK